MEKYIVEYFIDTNEGDSKKVGSELITMSWSNLMQRLTILKRDNFVPEKIGHIEWNYVNIWDFKEDGYHRLLRVGMEEF